MTHSLTVGDAASVGCAVRTNDPQALAGAHGAPYESGATLHGAPDDGVSNVNQSIQSCVPRLRRGFRLQYEPVQHCHVLLYPEGMIKLNDSAGEILKCVDGVRDVASIIGSLVAHFPGVPGIDEDILAFIEVAHAQFWIEFA